MSLTFLKNIRLFNKKDHTPARAHPKRGHSSLLWNPGGSGKHAHHTHGGGAEFSSFAEERRSTCPPTRTGGAHPKSRPLPENHSSPKERSHRPHTSAHGEHRKERFGKDKSFERRGMGDWKEGNAINAPSPTHAYAHQTARTRRVSHGRGAHGKPPPSRKPFLSKRTITPPPHFRPRGTSKRGIR